MMMVDCHHQSPQKCAPFNFFASLVDIFSRPIAFHPFKIPKNSCCHSRKAKGEKEQKICLLGWLVSVIRRRKKKDGQNGLFAFGPIAVFPFPFIPFIFSPIVFWPASRESGVGATGECLVDSSSSAGWPWDQRWLGRRWGHKMALT